jgi:hypothetical protein
MWWAQLWVWKKAHNRVKPKQQAARINTLNPTIVDESTIFVCVCSLPIWRSLLHCINEVLEHNTYFIVVFELKLGDGEAHHHPHTRPIRTTTNRSEDLQWIYTQPNNRRISFWNPSHNNCEQKVQSSICAKPVWFGLKRLSFLK